MPPAKVHPFDVFKALVEEDNKGIHLAPLNNIIRARKVKAGTEVTIGVAGDMVAPIMEGRYRGGLILCDRDEYVTVEKELEEAAEVAVSVQQIGQQLESIIESMKFAAPEAMGMHIQRLEELVGEIKDEEANEPQKGQD